MRFYSAAMLSGVIGRGIVWSLIALASGCASSEQLERRSERLTRSTLAAVYESVARGDETQYRRLVQIERGDAYSDALTTTMFASIRLHQAVEQRGSKDREDASDAGSATAAGESHASSRPSSLAAVDYRQNARAMVKAVEGWTFTVRGDRATIDQLADQPGAPVLRRVNGRWLLVPTHWDMPRDTATYRLMIANERRLAGALAAARRAVDDGSARTIEDVNAVLRRLLSEPTAGPTTHRAVQP